MRIEQALYGEVQGRGHGLKSSSTQERIVAEIASKLDLPDAVPPGALAWSPFVRGFPIGDHYVLARTFLDTGASRGGMVLSHALIARLKDICEANSLAPFLERLASSPAGCTASMSTLELDITGNTRPPAADLKGTANALASRGIAPVVRLGIEGFEHSVDSLWQNFWPALRRTFAFRLSFGPQDIVEQPPPVLVCTPEQLRIRWTKYRIVNPDDQAPASEAAGVISGLRDATPILTLASNLGLEVQSLETLTKLERLHQLLAEDAGFDNLLAAVRLVDGLSNEPTLGVETKGHLLRRLVSKIPQATCGQLRQMRNLALAGFAQTGPLWAAVERFFGNLNYVPGEDGDLTGILLAAVDSDLALQPWRDAVVTGLVASARQDGPELYRGVWRWAERSQSAFAAVLHILPAENSIEQRLADAAPAKFQGANTDGLLASLLTKRWLTVHGAVLAATRSPLDAVRLQLGVDKDEGNITGVRAALRHASHAQILECTVTLKSPRLLTLCAGFAVDHPRMLVGIRGEDTIEQKIWGTAIRREPSLWKAPADPFAVRNAALAQLARGRPVDTDFLEALASTPLADLSAAPGRAGLWTLFPTSCGYEFLKATAIGWLNSAEHGATPIGPEFALEDAILKSRDFHPTLENRSTAVEVRLAIIGALPSFKEDWFIAWLDNLLGGMHSKISQPASEQLGTLIANRRWERAARHLAGRYAAHRRELLPGLRLCEHMLGILDRWRLGISKPSSSEKWTSLEEEACDLYSAGPDANELWSRSGGKNSDLPALSQSGATRWHAALKSVRQGSRPNARELLAEMIKDFPSNEKLRFYANDADIVGWR